MNETVSEFFKKKAKESFDKEKQLYKNEWNNVEELYKSANEDNGYENFQSKLRSNIFGSSYSFLFSFCDNKFLKKIITTGTGRIEKAFQDGELTFLRKTISERDSENGFQGLYHLTELEGEKREGTLREISRRTAEVTFDKLINSKIITFKGEYYKTVQELYQQSLYAAFSSFGYRFKEKGVSGAVKKKKIDEEGKEISEFELLYLTADQEGIHIQKGEQDQLYFDVEELKKILKQSLQQLPKTIQEAKKDINCKINLTTTSNEFLVQFKSNNDKSKDEKKFISQVAEIFHNVVYKSLGEDKKQKNKIQKDEIEVSKKQNDFNNFWTSKGEASFKKLGIKKIKKILSANQEATVSGELGETMVAIFLETLPTEQQEIVKVFGREIGKTGQAAVDIGLVSSKIGFQVKNYTSIDNSMALYSQSNDLFANDIIRYLEQSTLEKFRNDISLGYKEKDEIEEEKVEENLVNLQESIPHYLRYDEAQGAADAVKEYQNNFYILNFRIIPASILFYIMAQIVKEQENKAKDLDIFFLTSEKQKAGRNDVLKSNGNFVDTYKIMREKKINNKNSKVYVNFKGIKVEFKKQIQLYL